VQSDNAGYCQVYNTCILDTMCTPVLQLVDVQQCSNTLTLVAEQYESVRSQDVRALTVSWWRTAAAEILPSHCSATNRSHLSLIIKYYVTKNNAYAAQYTQLSNDSRNVNLTCQLFTKHF